MKTAEEYINDFWGGIRDGVDSLGRNISGYDVGLVIKQTQREAIEETVRRLGEVTTVTTMDGRSKYLYEVYADKVEHDIKKELGL